MNSLPQIPTSEWAIACFDRIYTGGNPDQLDAILELLGGLLPTQEESKHKHEVTWDVIDYAYGKTSDREEAARRYLGLTG